jgi:hypothetical protein
LLKNIEQLKKERRQFVNLVHSHVHLIAEFAGDEFVEKIIVL